MADRFRTIDIPQISQRGIFFDANILLYLFWPTRSVFARTYSSLYRVLMNNNVQMYVDFIVISEVVNRAIRIEYYNYTNTNTNGVNRNSFSFKNYRNCSAGQQTVLDVYNIIKSDIISNFQVSGKCFDESDINHFLSLNLLDFSDKAIELICMENNFVLLTNDSDFRNSSLDILSENTNLT